MIVRRLRDDDLDTVVAILRAVRFLGDHTEAEDRAYLRSQPELWVAERDAEVVGFMALSPGWIEQLHVAAHAQRTGVGSALVAQAKALMGEIRLHTHQANDRARSFYAGHGFAEIERGLSPAPECAPDVLLLWRRAS